MALHLAREEAGTSAYISERRNIAFASKLAPTGPVFAPRQRVVWTGDHLQKSIPIQTGFRGLLQRRQTLRRVELWIVDQIGQRPFAQGGLWTGEQGLQGR